MQIGPTLPATVRFGNGNDSPKNGTPQPDDHHARDAVFADTLSFPCDNGFPETTPPGPEEQGAWQAMVDRLMAALPPVNKSVLFTPNRADQLDPDLLEHLARNRMILEGPPGTGKTGIKPVLKEAPGEASHTNK